MLFIDISMLIFPPVLAWLIHIYLRHGDVSRKRKFIFFVIYLFLVNICTIITSYVRGVKGLNFTNMTFSYKIKYLGMSCIFSCVIPFLICLLAEDQITVKGIKRYVIRFLKDMRRYFPYVIRSAKADLRAEVASSFLDWLWWMIEPFCMMIIYVLIFGIALKASELYFPVFIFLGLAMYTFFSRGITGSVDLVRNNREVVTKVYLPKYILLFSKMLVNGFKMMVSFAIVVIMILFFRIPITVNILCFFPIITVLFLLTFGMGTILMHYGVYVSDLSYIIGILTNMLMYLSGIFYSIINNVPSPFGELLEKFNPVAFLIASMRNAVLYGKAPDWHMLGIWAFFSGVLSLLGIFTIYHNENSYVKVI